MVTIVVYNNDINGALKALKRIQQQENTFKCVKSKKYYKNNAETATNRFTEIVKRKIKEYKEKKLSIQNEMVKSKITPFIFNLDRYIVKIFDSGAVVVMLDNKNVLKTTIDKIDFDNIESSLKLNA